MKFLGASWSLVTFLKLILFFYTTLCKPATQWKERIVSGEVAEEGQFPYHVGIFKRNSSHPFCSGALVSAYYVLTAAHCFSTVNRKHLFVRLGIRDLVYESDTERNISAISLHSDFNYTNYNHDIALVTLNSPVDMGRKIKIVPLPDSKKEQYGKRCVISGWGRVGYSLPSSRVLLHASVPKYNHDLCKYAYNLLFGKTVTDNMLCYGGCKGDSCVGDSGGPLVCPTQDGRMHLVGIASFGPVRGCGLPGIPGVYTDVSVYLESIRSAINKPKV